MTRPRRAFGPGEFEHAWSFYFSNEPTEEFGYYGSGFLEAARTLARSFVRRRSRKQIDIVPVLFLYRHSIELLAKGTVLSGNRLLQQRGEGREERDIFFGFSQSRHRLLPLFDSVEKIFDSVGWVWHWPKSLVESSADARRAIEELEALDRDSYSFRYPTNIRGKRSIPTHHMIGQRTILAVLDDLAESLDTAIFGLDAECSRT